MFSPFRSPALRSRRPALPARRAAAPSGARALDALLVGAVPVPAPMLVVLPPPAPAPERGEAPGFSAHFHGGSGGFL